MSMSRRAFAQTLGAGIFLLPFMSPKAWGGSQKATAVPKRIIIITSLGTVYNLWKPLSAPGQSLILPASLQPLSTIADRIVLADGLSFPNPAEGHSTPQTLSGFTFSNGYGPNASSVDQYLASKAGVETKLPSLLLGWQAKDEGQFWQAGRRLTPLDTPADAWQLAFSGAAPAAAATATPSTLPKQRIWDLVATQLKDVQKTLGSEANARLNDHLQSLAALEKNASGGTLAAGCAAPAEPTLGGLDAHADTSTDAVASAQVDLITAALACDVTRVVGMQWGVSNRQYIAGAVSDDEHSAVHSGQYGQDKVIAAEAYLCTWFAKLVNNLASMPDPLDPGHTLLDNTLILWTRDIGDGPTHMQYSMPYVLAGATNYLKTQKGGAYYNFGGDNGSRTVGKPHQRLLLNLCEFMGVPSATDFGTVSKLAAGDQAPLPDLKA
jgi:hypothetical protein